MSLGDISYYFSLFFHFKSQGSKALSFGLLAGMAFGKMASKGQPESGGVQNLHRVRLKGFFLGCGTFSTVAATDHANHEKPLIRALLWSTRAEFSNSSCRLHVQYSYFRESGGDFAAEDSDAWTPIVRCGHFTTSL